jgi:phosphopantothenoylcysteine decarboxylase
MKNIATKPVVICPAMNTFMYEHPITEIQIQILTQKFGFELVDSIEKKLMCGDIGMGAMAKTETIALKIMFFFRLSQTFKSCVKKSIEDL